jgi:hypothetical protein
MIVRTAKLATLLTLALSLPVAAQTPASPAAPAEKPPAAEAPSRLGYLINQRSLPTQKDAREYAEGWLMAAGLTDTVVGKLRPAGGLYVVDLHPKSGGKTLTNQLLLRKQDGYAVLVYPAGKPPEKSAEKSASADPQREAALRNAMAGMAGMSGTRGIYGGSADPGIAPTFSTADFLIRTPAEAGTAARLWLFQNGLKNLKVGAIKEQGGVYVGQVLARENGEQRNQFVIRRADGFIAMVNPVKVPAPTAGVPPVHGR